jgi:NADH-quinone oxidoreductase subunit H
MLLNLPKVFTFLISTIFLFIFILIAVAYFTHAERKILGATQRRRGPNVIGVFGLLQPLSDGLKLLTKEPVLPSSSDKIVFVIAPMLTFIVSLISWVVIPFSKNAFLAEISLSSLYLLACSALGIYGILASGWASNSKYAFLGAMRSAAQMVSYELPIGLILCILVSIVGSYNLNAIIEFQAQTLWFVFMFPLLFLVFFTCIVAETNRHPFDLPEAEAELVSGYNVEYAAMSFALFSLGEYGNILLMSSFTIILFFGGWLPPFFFLDFLPYSFWFGLKIIFFVIIFVLLRAGLPRYRYDQLMEIGWQVLLPVTLGFLIYIYSILWIFNGFPY